MNNEHYLIRIKEKIYPHVCLNNFHSFKNPKSLTDTLFYIFRFYKYLEINTYIEITIIND